MTTVPAKPARTPRARIDPVLARVPTCPPLLLQVAETVPALASLPATAAPVEACRADERRTVRRVRPWDAAAPGVLALPSGRLVRGRGLRRGDVEGAVPQFGLYLLGAAPAQLPWPSRWVRWPDWWLPSDRADAIEAIGAAWQRAARERVEVACDGGRGRTGTALACLAVLDGVPAADAVAYVRRTYHRQAVETPWQRRFVRRMPAVL
jgi:hypothetical protein